MARPGPGPGLALAAAVVAALAAGAAAGNVLVLPLPFGTSHQLVTATVAAELTGRGHRVMVRASARPRGRPGAGACNSSTLVRHRNAC